jgi:hypothetical protein
VDYSLFIVLAMMVMLMKAEEQPVPTPVVFPPSIFAELLRFMFFSVDARSLASLRYLEYILAF